MLRSLIYRVTVSVRALQIRNLSAEGPGCPLEFGEIRFPRNEATSSIADQGHLVEPRGA